MFYRDFSFAPNPKLCFEGLQRKRKIFDAFLRIGIVFAVAGLLGITVGNP